MTPFDEDEYFDHRYAYERMLGRLRFAVGAAAIAVWTAVVAVAAVRAWAAVGGP